MKKFCLLVLIAIILISCLKEKVKLPTVVTSPIKEVTWEYALAGGEVIDDGGSPVLSRGVSTYTQFDKPWVTVDGTGIGEFTSKIDIRWHGATGSFSETHYLRAYATNKAGTSYGEELSFYPKSKPPSLNAIKLESVIAKTTSATIKYSTEPIPSYSIAEIGICYGTISNPTFEGNHVIVSSTSTSFAFIAIDNLTQNTTYYVKGYVTNESGTSYSQEISFTTGEGEISDIDGNIYQIKTIGSQTWMIENLKVSKLNNGTILPIVQENLEWSSTTTSAYCTFDNNIYGKLYNFYAVADNRKLCPSGWHVPSDNEWKIMETYLGMTQSQADISGLRGTNEGGELKLSGCSPEGWSCYNVGATNSSGFSALAGGYRYDNGIFSNIRESAYFWTSTEYDNSSALNRSLSKDNAQIGRLNVKKGFGFSVRCIKD
jgi:uncharacterized protein (TIGR02145 family)